MKQQKTRQKKEEIISLDVPIYLAFVAYNEERTLPSAFKSVETAAKYATQFFRAKFKAVICHNGCTDKTPNVAHQIAKNSRIPAKVITSEKGMVVAQNQCVRHIMKDNPNSIIIFTDADCIMNKDVIKLFLDQFHKHKELLIVGAHPIPARNPHKNIFNRIKHKVLNFRAYHPKAQISAKYAPQYHPYAFSDPQPIGSNFEIRSKTYVHGRCFALRRANLWDVPEDTIGEDTYLDCSLHIKHGTGCMRQLYHANVYFNPLDSVKNYINTYARIYKDKKCLSQNKKFRNNFEYSKTKLDFGYLKEIGIADKSFFLMYWLLDKTSHILFKSGFFVRKSTSVLWNYKSKEALK